MQLTSPLVLIFSTLFLGTIAAPSGSSSGIVIPNNLPNGGYYVTVSSSGKYSAPIALSPLEKKSFPNPLDLESRQLPDPEIGCSGYNINDGDFASARYSLNTWCDAGNVFSSGAVYWVSNTAVAYICNYGGQQPCSSGEYDDTNNLINDNCGGSSAGWVLINDWAKGYGRDNTGVPICSGGYTTK